MPFLTSVSITFNTHNDNKNASTVVHVFVKNRLNTSQSPEHNSDFISNWLTYQRYLPNGDLNDDDSNPYLAYSIGLGVGEEFPDPSSRTFSLTLRSNTISIDNIVLPVVNIHILTDDNDRWIFDYTIAFTFDDATTFNFSSNVDGMTGIVLDQDNRDYSGICTENPFHTFPPFLPAPTNAVLTRVTLEFGTHNDNKNADTRLNAHIVNRLSASSAQDLAIGLDLFSGQEFADPSYNTFSWSSVDGSLASNTIRMADMRLPMVYIAIAPTGYDRWAFDYRVTFEFTDSTDFGGKPHIFSSRTNGVVLDQDNKKHAGAYQGLPFPTVSPPTAPRLGFQPVDHTTIPKTIPIAFLRTKFDEFINHRNGSDTSHNPPLKKLRLHNSGKFNSDANPESYVDIRSITAGIDHVQYFSNPLVLGQLNKFFDLGDLYFNDVNSSALSISIDPTQPAPITLTIDFDTTGANGTLGHEMDFLQFSISLSLTLDIKRTVAFGAERTLVDVMSWVSELQGMHFTPVLTAGHPYVRCTGTFLHQPQDLTVDATVSPLGVFVERVIRVSLNTKGVDLATEIFRTGVRDKIYEHLTTADRITGKTPLDGINSMVTSWLLGGVADDDHNTDGNNAVISNIGIQGDNIVITYGGPRNGFVDDGPPDWPTAAQPNPAYDFSPGNLANIDHIVVLTMENRSFDHILGYLSLPPAQGGMGRTDVDGLKGNESNVYSGTTYPSFPLTSTRFSPDPPHGYEPVFRAINGGRMDGFVTSYAEDRGPAVAGNIMGYHSAATVPVFDALARDFVIGHRWFASHPGPTFCNRFYEVTGRLNLDTRGFWEFDNSAPLRPVFADTIFDHLTDAIDPITGQKVTWTYFEYGYCFLRFFERHTFDEAPNIVNAEQPGVGFFDRAAAGALPNVSFIDPHYIELPPDGNDDGPPADVKDGQAFVRKVVEAVVASPTWNKTMLVIVYDEHGGFYDHVPPSTAARVSPDLPIITHGVRVPAFVISPWVSAGAVFGHDGTLQLAGSRTGPIPTGIGAAQGGTAPEPALPAVPAVPARQVEATAVQADAAVGVGGEQVVGGVGERLHFDHTSILKTIARRFLSTNPPYMGARFAAAKDLSAVIGSVLRKPQFLPFIRYNIQFGVSQLMLDVQGANKAAGTALWQYAKNGTVAQDFSFEDAGEGFVYIRSCVSNLYVTVDVTPTFVDTSARSAGGSATGAANPSGPGLIQDVKYAPRLLDAVTGARPELQKWRFTPVGLSPFAHAFLISSQAFAERVLQPVPPTGAQAAVVLGVVAQGVHIQMDPNAWHVSTPLLSDQVVATP